MSSMKDDDVKSSVQDFRSATNVLVGRSDKHHTGSPTKVTRGHAVLGLLPRCSPLEVIDLAGDKYIYI